MRLQRHPGNPILAPIAGHAWESRTVFNCGTAERDDRYLVYYVGADKVIAVATAIKDDLLRFAVGG